MDQAADTCSMKVLLVCCDSHFADLAEELLSDHELDVISDARQIKNLSDMNAIFQHDSFDLLILSNLGIPAELAMQHVSMLPETRLYRAVLLSGVLDDNMIATCRNRGVAAYQLPLSAEEIIAVVQGRLERRQVS